MELMYDHDCWPVWNHCAQWNPLSWTSERSRYMQTSDLNEHLWHIVAKKIWIRQQIVAERKWTEKRQSLNGLQGSCSSTMFLLCCKLLAKSTLHPRLYTWCCYLQHIGCTDPWAQAIPGHTPALTDKLCTLPPWAILTSNQHKSVRLLWLIGKKYHWGKSKSLLDSFSPASSNLCNFIPYLHFDAPRWCNSNHQSITTLMVRPQRLLNGWICAPGQCGSVFLVHLQGKLFHRKLQGQSHDTFSFFYIFHDFSLSNSIRGNHMLHIELAIQPACDGFAGFWSTLWRVQCEWPAIEETLT